jgi:hypothetical protein
MLTCVILPHCRPQRPCATAHERAPLSSIPLATFGHTDDGADRYELHAFLSVPGPFATHVNDRAEPALPSSRIRVPAHCRRAAAVCSPKSPTTEQLPPPARYHSHSRYGPRS